jgi:D-amino-acid dehydrogenase
MNDARPEGIWAGLRPLSPDGLPYIGKSSRFDNLYIGAGHSMMGISLAPVTGQILAEMVKGEKPAWDLKLLSPDRF